MLGNAYHPSPDACYKRFLEAGGVLPDEDLLTTYNPIAIAKSDVRN